MFETTTILDDSAPINLKVAEREEPDREEIEGVQGEALNDINDSHVIESSEFILNHSEDSEKVNHDGEAFKKLERQLEESKIHQEYQQNLLTKLIQVIPHDKSSDQNLEEKTEKVEIVPDKNIDPDKWLEYQINNINSKYESLSHSIQKQQAHTYAEEVINAAKKELQEFEQGYQQSTPEYIHDKENAFSAEIKKMKAWNPNISEQSIRENLEKSFLQFASDAVARGEHPVKLFHEFIKKAYDLPVKDSSPKRDHEALSRNREKHKTLSSNAASNKQVPVTLEDLDSMTYKEIAALRQRIGERHFDALLRDNNFNN